jgi:transglutaminase-like putative cysteine protease
MTRGGERVGSRSPCDAPVASVALSTEPILHPEPLRPFLAACEVIDRGDRDVAQLARTLLPAATGDAWIAVAFEWVRDEIAHTGDAGGRTVTLRASDVLRHRTGLCYAKSHLLVALLRARGVAAGLCYQRLRTDGPDSPFVLHGLVAARLADGRFQRIDPRGNKPGVNAQFTVGREQLAFALDQPGEADIPGVFARPLPAVVHALASARDWPQLCAALPDLEPARWPAGDADW